ncbi:MAG: hypothetical protein ACQESH_04170, partial [Campylobacterota bacterium]
VLSATAVAVLPKNQAIGDAKYIASQLSQKRFHAQGDQGGKSCIEFDAMDAIDDEYSIKSEVDPDENKVCFDWMGRVYDDEEATEPIDEIIETKISAQGKVVSILIYPYTGYVKILHSK